MNASWEAPPANPFLALRTSYGMLLGQGDFDVLVGYPRGKQMLHGAWLHGPGVVWGYRVEAKEPHTIDVGTGLAVDGWGRELHLGTAVNIDLRDLLKTSPLPEGGSRTAEAWLAAAYRPRPSHPVPALADPCDVSRKHSEFSRTSETVRFLLLARPPGDTAYTRLRKLRGAGPVTPEAFHTAAVLDTMEREPADRGHDAPFPVDEAQAPVILAKLTLRVRGSTLDGVEAVDPAARGVLLPTGLLQELASPGGGQESPDAGGPRVVDGSLEWHDKGCGLRFRLDGPVLGRSLDHRTLSVACLTAEGWSEPEITGIAYHSGRSSVSVTLSELPPAARVRVVVRGTGPFCVLGADGVPLAGLTGGPPGGRAQGHDAVLIGTTPDERKEAP